MARKAIKLLDERLKLKKGGAQDKSRRVFN